jgi:hypothetical protein
MINRRMQPLMVAGTWDFLGVLLATSGFLLFVGPAFLSGTFRESLRDVATAGESVNINSAVSEIWGAWWTMWLLYYGLVLVGGAFLVWSRRNTTVIYNVEPRNFETTLLATTQRMNLPASRLGNRLFLGISSLPTSLSVEEEPTTEVLTHVPAALESRPAQPAFSERVIVDIEVFAPLRNVSLHWRHASPAARTDFERELQRGLVEVVTIDNPVGGWLLGIAAFLVLAIMMLTAVFVIGTVVRVRH